MKTTSQLAALAIVLLSFHDAHAATESYGEPSSSDGVRRALRIAVIGSSAVADRLKQLGFKADIVQEQDADPSKLTNYSMIYLPTGWAQHQQQMNHYDNLAAAYHKFVQSGGALIVGQPNPYQMPRSQCQPKLLPYPVLFVSPYQDKDTARVSLTKTHFITADLKDHELPFPFDEMRDIDKRYQQLAKQKSTNICSLAVCEFGAGRVLIHTASEMRKAKVELSDRMLKRMVTWAARP